MLKGFKDFILRGNVVELAIAVVIGTAFTAVVASFTDALIQPILNAIGGAESPGFGITLIEGRPDTMINFGLVVTAIITFLITAAVVYFIFVVPMNKLNARFKKQTPEEEAAAPSEAELLLEIRDLLRAQNGKNLG